MRGRHAAELTHQLRRAALSASGAARPRATGGCGGRLEARDLAAAARRHSRTRLGDADGRLRAAGGRARQRADVALRVARRAGSRTSARWPCSRAAMRCAGTRTAPRLSAARRRSLPAIACTSRCSEGEIECDVDEALHRRQEIRRMKDAPELLTPVKETSMDPTSRISSPPSPSSRPSSRRSRTATSRSRNRWRCSSAACSSRASATRSWKKPRRRIEILTDRGEVKPAPASLGADPAEEGDRSR